ncbi:MAG: hypothetical protein M3R00_07010, partial [Pseudomonadota bacterium]|nr:hypothetical protein [Pseudomonadota bacterium]
MKKNIYLTPAQLNELYDQPCKAHDFMLEEAAWKVFFDVHFKHVTEDEAVTVERAYQIWQENYREHVGQFGKPDVTKIIADYKLAEHAQPRALTRLATLYEAGTHIPQNYPLAIELYDKAILRWEQFAMCNRANMHKEGRGGPVNLIAAAKLLRNACNTEPEQLKFPAKLHICTWIDRDNKARLTLQNSTTSETLRSTILKEFTELINLSHGQTQNEIKYHYERGLNHHTSLMANGKQNLDQFCIFLASDEMINANDKYYRLLYCYYDSPEHFINFLTSNEAVFAAAEIFIQHAEFMFKLAAYEKSYYVKAPNIVKIAHTARELLKKRADQNNDLEAQK